MLSMRRNVAEPYHTGLHTLLALEQKLGVQGVIQFAKTGNGLDLIFEDVAQTL